MSGKMTKQFKEAIINKLKSIDIPEWVNYIAVDRNGDVCGFRQKPLINNKKCIWMYLASETPNVKLLFHTDFDSTNWKNTLIELKTLNIDVFIKFKDEVRKIENITAKVSQPKSILKFKVWQPADTFLVYQILEAENIPDDTNYNYASVNVEYDLLHPEKVIKNYEGIEVFETKEDRHAFIGKMIKNLKELFSKDKQVKVTEKDIGKNVETDCGVARLEALTTDGKYVVTFNDESRLFMVDNAWFNVKSDCNFNRTVLADMSELYTFSA